MKSNIQPSFVRRFGLVLIHAEPPVERTMVECLTSLKTIVEFLIKTQYVIIDQLYDKCSI